VELSKLEAEIVNLEFSELAIEDRAMFHFTTQARVLKGPTLVSISRLMFVRTD
jgi:hypothetical protein